MRNRTPVVPGGGTVSYVAPTEHRYVTDPETREDGGTPAIVESIRAGVGFALKDALGTDLIEECETRAWHEARDRLAQEPGIRVLGDTAAARLPVVSQATSSQSNSVTLARLPLALTGPQSTRRGCRVAAALNRAPRRRTCPWRVRPAPLGRTLRQPGYRPTD